MVAYVTAVTEVKWMEFEAKGAHRINLVFYPTDCALALASTTARTSKLEELLWDVYH